jgi:signal peptidase II
MSTVPPRTSRYLPIVLILAAVVLGLDQGTKFWAVTGLTGRPPVPVLGDFIQLCLIYNSGAAFSIGAGSTWLFAVVAAVAVVVISAFARRVRSFSQAVAVGLLLGGATTHLLDRLFRAPGFGRGHVVDFIDYNGWFVGNVADIALTIGAVILVVITVFARNDAAGTAGETTEPTEPTEPARSDEPANPADG